jgi:DNA (cytosine-5)-methyltransferase 1
MLRFFDFCAGIGAGRLGLESGIKAKCIGFSEILQASINTYSIIHDVKKKRTTVIYVKLTSILYLILT